MNELPLLAPFQYAEEALRRRHGPQGYSDPQRYKPWLRDEFQFRCVYCLCRERWCPDGEDAFGVEHYRPQVLAPGDICNYENLLYACCRCNAAKRDLTRVLNPAQVPYWPAPIWKSSKTARSMVGTKREGRELIQICQLDRANLTEFRRGIIEVWGVLQSLKENAQRDMLRRYFGFPSNLPRLATLRPPGGNARPQGIESSFYERRRRGELAECY